MARETLCYQVSSFPLLALLALSTHFRAYSFTAFQVRAFGSYVGLRTKGLKAFSRGDCPN